MVTAKARRSFGLLLPLALLALLIVLGWLQYRWTGALSRAEAERLRSGLRSSLARFGGELDFELARILRAFSMRAPSELPEALDEFRQQSHYPEIVAGLYRLGFDQGQLELERLLEDGTFDTTSPPPGLERLSQRAEALRNPQKMNRVTKMTMTRIRVLPAVAASSSSRPGMLASTALLGWRRPAAGRFHWSIRSTR